MAQRAFLRRLNSLGATLAPLVLIAAIDPASAQELRVDVSGDMRYDRDAEGDDLD